MIPYNSNHRNITRIKLNICCMCERRLGFLVGLGSFILSHFDTIPSCGVIFLHVTQCMKSLMTGEALKREIECCASLVLKE
jgi:hypothetical protein